MSKTTSTVKDIVTIGAIGIGAYIVYKIVMAARPNFGSATDMLNSVFEGETSVPAAGAELGSHATYYITNMGSGQASPEALKATELPRAALGAPALRMAGPAFSQAFKLLTFRPKFW